MAIKKRNRVLFLVYTLYIGGSEKKAINLANRLADEGYSTTFAYFCGDEKLLESVGEKVKIFTPKHRGKFDLISKMKYRRFVLAHQFDCVITMGLFAGLMHKVCLLFSKVRPKEIIGLNTSVLSPKERKRLLLYKTTLRKTHIIFGAKKQRNVWKEEYGFHPVSSEVIYNGVDITYFDPKECLVRERIRNKYNCDQGDIVLGVVAALRPEKAIGDLILATSRLRELGAPVKVLVVGDGIELKRLKEIVTEKSLSKDVKFLGALSDVRPVLSALDIFILPSVAVETFSNAALEAMAIGLPVILSDVGGAREMIIDGESGIIFPPGNIDILVNSIETLIQNKEKRNAMGVWSRRRILEHFNIEEMLSQYRKLIDESRPI